MTPKEKFNQQVWEILQGIEEEILATEKNKPVKYRIPNVIGGGIIPKDRRIKILYKLQELGAFEIQRNSEGVRIGTGDIFYLIINSLKFDEVYKKFQKACDINSYLNDFQQKASSKEEKPKFSQVKFSDKATRRGVEKKWDVLQAIWGVYESHSRPDSVLVPVARVAIKGRDVQLIDGIIEGLGNEDLFQKWDRKDRWYNIEFINHEMLPKYYSETESLYKKLASEYQRKNQRKQKKKAGFKGKGLTFSEDESAIKAGKLSCPLPPYKNEFDLCKVMFKQKIGAPIEWNEVYEAMTGDEGFESKWRAVYDTMRRVNNRFMKSFSTKDKLFSWQNKTIKRNF